MPTEHAIALACFYALIFFPNNRVRFARESCPPRIQRLKCALNFSTPNDSGTQSPRARRDLELIGAVNAVSFRIAGVSFRVIDLLFLFNEFRNGLFLIIDVSKEP
ncbi:hypothetical protein A6X21_01305 [Planctopirus hydrillae]|uniref:Uncharacterized protein n=1 Tax=Planctopirus hydrillae TaxID=1841610 RepID=A0A1C3E4W0_9PLAN|nr:hypothetical protein A6X21_01305 [Planctopirus hydrillae]